VEADMRRDIVWHRPTWPLGNSPETLDPNGFGSSGFDDSLGIFEGGNDHRFSSAEARDLGLDAEQRHAMAVLSVEGPFNVESVKARYKALVKRHHPDANSDDGASDDKIKEINQAYQVVMEFLAP
ncbi:MAG: J domain-containing protein, partial [Pseudomonadota bacterium]|nr:J domain-containing protein [Pseudomonadota bacterium]